ncbi:MAG: PEP-CTERM sorting domain-containing protein [Phycisphaerales bacterium]|jgi:hypothetical protein|nr:PEP-CTERM sorting domain-containing protein [Phycisphaerales bacterium]
MRNTVIVWFGLASLVLSASGVLADDLNPPPWRHADRTTFQAWEFGADDATAPEDGFTMPPNEPLPAFPKAEPYAFITGGTWIDDPDDTARQGVWSLTTDPTSSWMNLFISNYSGGAEKKVWLQLTWMANPKPFPVVPDGAPAVSVQPGFSPTPVPLSLISEQDLGDEWFHSTYLVTLEPNPEFEMFIISGDIMIDEVVVDTICPEPGTLMLLCVGIPLALKRKRKARN